MSAVFQRNAAGSAAANSERRGRLRPPAHPHQSSVDVASLAPNAEITVYPWREPPDLKARTTNRVRSFLRAHVPMRAAAQ